MESFLDKVAEYILRISNGDPGNTCVVTTNRRAGLFLGKKIASKIKEPVWSPDIYAIEDLVWELSGMKKADLAEQLFILYGVYRDSEKEKAESFDLFCKWAPSLLSDFNECDAHLADTKKLFGNLSDIRNIENWSLGQTELTDFQKQYVHFWASIGKWYGGFRNALEKKKLANTGLASRYVAENISSLIPGDKWKKIIFTGFNALTPAEEKMITVLRGAGLAEILWDADRYYLEDKTQEAGKFLRDHRKNLFAAKNGQPQDFIHVEDHLSSSEKKITVAGVARNVSQAKAAAWFIDQVPENIRYSPETAIVLADENLLLPLLNNIPGHGPINITMGFPFRNMPVAGFVNAIFRLHENADRFNIHSREGELKFYHADLERIFRHPYFRSLCANKNIPSELTSFLTRSNSVFCTRSSLEEVLQKKNISSGVPELFLHTWKNVQEAIFAFLRIISELRVAFAGEEENKHVELENIFLLWQLLHRVQTLFSSYTMGQDTKVFRAVLEQQIAAASLPFYGEPLEGLQVMGFLETRTLDFKNVVLLSANENILPAAKNNSTFIIYELRKAFGLPTFHDRDAVTAYNFYRLLQRAENIFITYNTDTDLFGNKEKSRFVTQLLHELPLVNKKVTIHETVFAAGDPEGETVFAPIVIPKDNDVRKKLDAVSQKGFSPSSLNTYLQCALRFYFRYVAHIKESDDVEEIIGDNTMGTIIHRTLEELYKPALGKNLDTAFYTQALVRAEEVCNAAFRREFGSEGSSTGKNLLAKKIALRYVQSFLGKELENSASEKLKLEGLEKELKAVLEINGKKILVTGKADRIDKNDCTVRIIDYKTGKTEWRELRFEETSELKNDILLAKSFQLMTYAWLYKKNNPQTENIISGIISFRNLKEGLMHVQTAAGELPDSAMLDQFGEMLKEIISEILDAGRSFAQTPEVKRCRNCDYKNICGRE
ncbi:MAG: PD-(D/E)XK nuclease family protein [Bacteroidetes bacterium]|nr:PD-(D/E)XK nuclease family protein [Bacteroidota bacterium]